MKKWVFVLLFSIACNSLVMSQVKFETGSFAEALAKAKKENKLLFLDAYTSWCGPCKIMAEKVFPQVKVGDFMNKEFICMKVDMEKGEGPALNKKYGVSAYPTFLLLNGDGEEIHRVVGGSDADTFIGKLKEGANLENSIYGMRKRYEKGERSKAFLKAYMEKLKAAGDRKFLPEVGGAYMALLSGRERLSADGWDVYSDYYIIGGSQSEGFRFVVDNKAQFEKIAGTDKVDQFLYNTYSPYIFGFIAGSKYKKDPYTPEMLHELREQIRRAKIRNEQSMMVQLEMGEARGQKDIDKLLKLYDEKLSLIPDFEHYRLLNILRFVKEEGTKEQVNKVVGILDKEIAACEAEYKISNLEELKYFISPNIRFEKGSLANALEKAKKENKLLFLDAYTSWCGPCKQMTEQVFTQEKVAAYFNGKFVNMKIDMEKGEGMELAKKYKVVAYPTFLLLNGDGEEIHRVVGGDNGDTFIRRIEEGLGENSISAFTSRYQQGDRNPDFVREYIHALQRARKNDLALEVIDEFWSKLTADEKIAKENWFILEGRLTDSNSPRFQYLLDHRKDFIKSLGTEKVGKKIAVTYSGLIVPYLWGRVEYDKSKVDSLKKLIKKNAPENSKSLFVLVNLSHARGQNNLNRFIDITEKEFSSLDDLSVDALVYAIGFIAEEGGTKEQCQRAAGILEKNRDKVSEKGKSYCERVIGYLQKGPYHFNKG